MQGKIRATGAKSHKERSRFEEVQSDGSGSRHVSGENYAHAQPARMRSMQRRKTRSGRRYAVGEMPLASPGWAEAYSHSNQCTA